MTGRIELAGVSLIEPKNEALKALISQLETQMRSELSKARASFAHKGNIGSGAEAPVRRMLREYLPRRLDVGHGEVIDSFGGRSPQTDVVITNEDHPFTFSPDLPGMFFVEGVSAAGEVKAVLTKQKLGESLANSVRFKRLRAANVSALANVHPNDPNAFGQHPPWFLLAFESALSLKTVEASLEAFQKSLRPDDRMADAVFILDRGGLFDIGDGKGPLRAARDNVSLSGWVEADAKEVLFDFLSWLSASVPRVVRMESFLTKYFMAHG